MNLDNYANSIGKVIVNFHGLELSLRGYLCESKHSLKMPPLEVLIESPIGTIFEINGFTSYDSLRVLITKFNMEMEEKGRAGIDASLVDLRDALAHGRVFKLEGEDCMRIVKFSKPDRKGANVAIEFNEVMTEQWLKKCTNRVCEAMFYVISQASSSPAVSP